MHLFHRKNIYMFRNSSAFPNRNTGFTSVQIVTRNYGIIMKPLITSQSITTGISLPWSNASLEWKWTENRQVENKEKSCIESWHLVLDKALYIHMGFICDFAPKSETFRLSLRADFLKWNNSPPIKIVLFRISLIKTVDVKTLIYSKHSLLSGAQII